MRPRTLLIAVGGNTLIHAGEGGSLAVQSARARVFAGMIADLVADGWCPIITHGNGPQVGFILRRGELARSGSAAEQIPDLPLWLAVADSQGGLGHILAAALNSVFAARQVGADVVAMLTHTVVDEFDPAFAEPTKPIGAWLEREAAERHRAVDGWDLVEEAGTFRRVVPSPMPRGIVEVATIRALVDRGTVVIAAGGGGIPVIRRGHDLEPVDAVIDKDRASALLASQLAVSSLVLVTGVDQVFVDFGLPTQRALDTITVGAAAQHLSDGQFPAGSMGPKVESALEFVRSTGSDALITSIERVPDALRGIGGTRFVPAAPELVE